MTGAPRPYSLYQADAVLREQAAAAGKLAAYEALPPEDRVWLQIELLYAGKSMNPPYKRAGRL